MDIKRAKQEIRDSIEAYLKKDAYGEYMIPAVRQRPILLMGPPGIGKTQIMEQIARECGIGLVSYTITHHTRQSAIGLPFIREKVYGGKTYSVTEYTMSEIIASVYDKMEETGLAEGILFIDEIHTLVGAGKGDGAMDAANILKPALARGELRSIGATTLDEYQKYFEKDKALERRFQIVMVDEPDEMSSISILRGLKER